MTANEAMKELSIIATATFPKVSDENTLPETDTTRLRESCYSEVTILLT
jgi:hypothetical protein